MSTFCYTITWNRRVGHPAFNVPEVLKFSKDDPRLTSDEGDLTWGPYNFFNSALEAVNHELACQSSEYFQKTLKALNDSELTNVNIYAVTELKSIRARLKAG